MFHQRFHSQDNRSAVTPLRRQTAMPPEGSTRAGILPGCPSLDNESREAEIGFEPRIFRMVSSRSNHLNHLALKKNVQLYYHKCSAPQEKCLDKDCHLSPKCNFMQILAGTKNDRRHPGQLKPVLIKRILFPSFSFLTCITIFLMRPTELLVRQQSERVAIILSRETSHLERNSCALEVFRVDKKIIVQL
ncbi:hypothetical protein CSKR_110752 [Clonorchis sinensis]|uniref:Uncharacterized protein n=1 Tax=Clonorchis sinensis TaxID=79923 RepID=A0A3R7DGA4_CLOSI|nr:hypothetical protein CSKR_110752 [Clonorchis sinensis]